MKRIFIRFKAGLALGAMLLFGAGTGALAQCDNFPNQFPAGVHTPSSDWTAIDGCSFAGEYAEVNVVAGNTYEFSTCAQGAFPAASYDTQLTLINPTTFVFEAFNDDACGLQSEISWVATYTGIIEVHLNEFDCADNVVCTTILTRETAAGGGGCADNVLVLEMNDSFGDGWNGAEFLVIDPLTSTVIESATFTTGSFAIAEFCLPDGCYDFEVTPGGFPGEVSWTLSGADVSPISGGAPLTGSFSVNTATCAVFGCTDSAALNFDGDATDDDGSCVVPDCADAPENLTYCYVANDNTQYFFEPTTPGGQVAVFFNAGTIEGGFDFLTVYDGDNAGAPVLFTSPATFGVAQLDGLALTSTLGNGLFITITSDGSVQCATSGTYNPFDFDVYCATAQIPGCTDAAAVNFDASATLDDGSCIVPPCPDPAVNFVYCYENGEAGTSFFVEPNTPGEEIVLFFNAGTVESATFDQLVIYDGDNTGAPVLYSNPVGVITQLEGLTLVSTNGNGILITISSDGSVSCGAASFGYVPWDINVFCGVVQIPGCTDPLAPNFNPDATTDDGSCEPPCLDTIVTIDLIDSFGDGWNGAEYTIIDLNTATVVASGTLPTGSFGQDGYCLPDGCYNFNVTGGTFPGEVSWVLDGVDGGPLSGGAPFNVDFTINTPDCSVFGCTDNSATNFNPAALIDNGTCVFCGSDLLLEIGMTDASGAGWAGATYSIVDVSSGSTVATGSLNNADTGNPFAAGTDLVCIPQGCYIFNVTGGANPGAIGWSVSNQIGTSFGSGSGNVNGFPLSIPLGNNCGFSGCTDPAAINFVPSADTDDGSCIFPPANNDVCDAEAVFCGGTFSGTLLNAGDNEGLIGESCNGVPVESPGVWYVINAAEDQQITASTCGIADGDTKIHVYLEGADCNDLICVAANDDGFLCANFTSTVSWFATTGQTFYILVSEFTANGLIAPSGFDFDLEISCEGCSAAVSNNDCANATPLISGAELNLSSCCMGVSGAPNAIADFNFLTAYDQFFVYNSGAFDSFSFALEANEPVLVAFYTGDCATLTQVPTAIDNLLLFGLVGSGADFDAILGGVQPNTNYYVAVWLPDPSACGDFSIVITGENFGCTDAEANNFDPNATENDGSCDYTGVTPGNDDCADAEALLCNDTVTGSTGGASGGALDLGCPTAAVPAVCGVVPPAGVDTSLQCYTDVVNADAFCCNTAWDGVCQGAYDACVAACGAAAFEVWYTLAGDDDLVTIGSCGSEIDAEISVVTSANGCAGPFEAADVIAAEACPFPNGDDGTVTFLAQAGVTYYVVVSSDTEGVFSLDVTCDEPTLGCTNPVAYNYDEDANIDDGSCDFFSQTCPGAGVPVQLIMYDAFGDGWNGASYSITDGFGTEVFAGDLDDADYNEQTFVGSTPIGAFFGFDLICLPDGCYSIEVGGGTFDLEVAWEIVLEDGTVIASGGTPAAGGGAGVFDFQTPGSVCGCTNSGACNFDPLATSEDGSCEFDSCAGCTDPAACNFDDLALIDDGSCCLDNCVTVDLVAVGGPVLFEVYTIDGTLAGSATVGGAPATPVGCTDVVAATVDPCDFDANSAAYQQTITVDAFCCTTSWDGLCQTTYEGFGGQPDPLCSAVPNNVLCLPDGCYYVVASGVAWTVFGTNTPGGFVNGGDAEASDFASFSLGSITCNVGCAEPIACNFDPAVNVPDNSTCDFSSCLGCTYPDATNFDLNAGIDDGSCEFDCADSCVGDLNNDGVINAADLGTFLTVFGTACP